MSKNSAHGKGYLKNNNNFVVVNFFWLITRLNSSLKLNS